MPVTVTEFKLMQPIYCGTKFANINYCKKYTSAWIFFSGYIKPTRVSSDLWLQKLQPILGAIMRKGAFHFRNFILPESYQIVYEKPPGGWIRRLLKSIWYDGIVSAIYMFLLVFKDWTTNPAELDIEGNTYLNLIDVQLSRDCGRK